MKHVLITGAYGGMGCATAKALAERGFTVFALDRRVKEAEPHVMPVEADVTDSESVKRAFEFVSSQTGELAAILHFAGIYRLDSLVEMNEERFTGIFNVNLFGAYRVNKTFLPLLKAGSRIILTTSELAPLAQMPFTGVYGMTKAALDDYASALRMELQLLGISVSVIRPGAVKTGLLSDSTRELEQFCTGTKNYTYNAEKFRKVVNSVEAKNVPPEKIAKTAVRALTAKQPKYVYNVNRNPLLRLWNVLPARCQTAVIRKILKPKTKGERL
ncbi:MAG: SDR family NAD(P)-dependent oxidoreductase [Oscillospiraceae bacterium]|nr:SDR family NAD(P)-dependent oxidoreductase [Oscillospiraceae bacterium]